MQEAHDFAAIAHAATLESRVPFMHFFDGFRTSHEVGKIDLIPEEVMSAMIDDDSTPLVPTERFRGSDALWEHASKQADGAGIALEAVYCLGLCAQSPAMTLDDKLHARVGIDKFNRLMAQTGSAA